MCRMKSDTFVDMLSARIQDDRHDLAGRWLNRLGATVPLEPTEIFPSVLGHIPDLIAEIGRFVAGRDGEPAGNSFMLAKARELGVLRYAQRASVHQLLHEYELLRGILETFALDATRQYPIAPSADVVRCQRRINQAINMLTRITVDTFVESYTRTMNVQARALEQFNWMVSHELRQPLAALQAAAPLVRMARTASDTERALSTIERNVSRLVELVSTITKVSEARVSGDRQAGRQRISLTMIAQQAARQLRETAASRQVQIHVQPDMPEIVVDVACLELMLTNLLSNAVKYADPQKTERFVDVSLVSQTMDRCTMQVRDNGVGMTPEQRSKIFRPFYRAHKNRDQELGVAGLGLGLAIVQDCARTLMAGLSVDGAPGDGTIFTITLPAHPPE
jgi:signal transduction histidine kinase